MISDNPVKTACHDDSRLNLRMAPNHDGIEGSRYGLVALAIPATAVLANGAAAIGAVAVNRTSMPYGSEITFADGYLGFVEAASYDFRAGKFSDVALVNGAGVHRAMFNAAGNRRWTVYFNKAAFDMPKAPQGFEDRTLDDKVDRATSTGKRSSIEYWAIKAKDGDAPLGVDELFDFAAGRAMNLSSYLTAFSMYDAEPSLGFNAPSGDACDKDGLCSVADGNFVFKVKITAFEVPTKVKILLEASSGQKVILDAMSADWIAQGKFSTPLMMDTTGNHTVTATMVKPDADPAHPELATPIDPKVVATLKVFVKS